MSEEHLPVTPYNGSSGWSGSDASRERAERQDADGTTNKRQREVLAIVRDQDVRGATYQEVGERMHLGHGAVSGALSNLHKAGLIDRLTAKRNKCQIYVMPDRVNGRPTAPPKPNRPRVSTELIEAYADVAALEATIEAIRTAAESNDSVFIRLDRIRRLLR